jgi:hypothetical protein
MVGEPDPTLQPAPQDNQLMSKHRVLSLKPQLRPEWRGQDGQSEAEQPDHSASLGHPSIGWGSRYTQEVTNSLHGFNTSVCTRAADAPLPSNSSCPHPSISINETNA